MKPTFVISCPIDTYSGYGARSRDLVKAIIELDKYNVKIMPQRWGDTPWDFIKDHPKWGFLDKHILTENPKMKPDIWMQITVPNEFQPIGNFNIGVTAGIETTVASAEFVEGCNRMDVTLVSSEHSVEALKRGQFQRINKNTQQVEGDIMIEKPLEVVFEGADLEVYYPMTTKQVNTMQSDPLVKSINEIKESFAYLFVGHWLPGDFGHDRKNISLLIKSFLETFKNKSKKPALILKTSKGNCSYLDRDVLVKQIRSFQNSTDSKNLPNIYLLHGEFTDEEMNKLYNHPKVKAMVSLTKGEGFGRPLLEFSLTQKPVIASGWSGHMDFLNEDYNLLIPGKLEKVHPSASNQFLLKESEWFAPDHGSINKAFIEVFKNYKKYQDLAKRQAYQSKNQFCFEAMKKRLDEVLDQYVPKQVELKLPSLETGFKLPELKVVK